MKSYKRSERVAEFIQQELAMLILHKKDNPLFAGVTITHLRMSPDLSHAKVYVTVLDKEKIPETIEALNKNANLFQNMLFKKVSMRGVPKLHFVYDESIMRAEKLAALIDEATKE